MKITQKVTGCVLLVLAVAIGIGLYRTSGTLTAPERSPSAIANQATPAIHQRYLDAALRLAQSATSPEEQQAAKKAIDSADRELDLEYAYALQMAAISPVPETPEIRAVEERITKIRDAISTRKTEIAQLQQAVARVTGERRDAFKEQLDVSQAELNLFQEALADAEGDLTRAGGDSNARLTALKAEHVAASAAADQFRFPAISGANVPGSLLAKWSEWRSIHGRVGQISAEQKQVLAFRDELSRLDHSFDERISAEQAKRKALKTQELTPQQIANLEKMAPRYRAAKLHTGPANPAKPVSPAAAVSAVPVSPAVALIQHLSVDQILMRLVDRRLEAVNNLATAYGTWSAVVATSARLSLHRVFAGGLSILLIMLVAFFLNRVIEHLFSRLLLERKQRTTLQAILRISVRLIAVLVILMLVFGKPSRLSTILGLAGAGMAVALQGFILSFFGWFVLMGGNGIRVGDWVEINSNAFSGVRGEVIEISLMRTILLETGDWGESAHHTGRQVAFMNMYAVTGYYFNFSTAGQWLWDEIRVAIPAEQNPHPLVERIRAIVVKETEADVKQAEQEWKSVSARYGTRKLSGEPSVSIESANHGFDAVVRYIAKADDRAPARHRLNRELGNLFHHAEEIAVEPEGRQDTDRSPQK